MGFEIVVKVMINTSYEVFQYSGTPPYDHPVYKTTSLLRSYSFKPNVKTIESFYYFDDPVNGTTRYYDQDFMAQWWSP